MCDLNHVWCVDVWTVVLTFVLTGWFRGELVLGGSWCHGWMDGLDAASALLTHGVGHWAWT